MLSSSNVVFSRDLKIYLRHGSEVPPWRMRNTFCKSGIISTIYATYSADRHCSFAKGHSFYYFQWPYSKDAVSDCWITILYTDKAS